MGKSELDSATRRACAANVPRFYAFNFLTMLQLWLPIWVLYLQRDRGLSLGRIALMEALFWLVIVLAEMPTGALADRWGRKPALVLSAVSFTAAILVFGFATNFVWLLVSYLIWGVSMTLGSGANTAFVYDSLAALGREDEFRKVWGRAQAFSIAAGLLGSLGGAPLAAATDLALPIRLGALTGAASVLAALTFREPRHHATAPHAPYVHILRQSAAYALRHPPLRAMIALTAIFTAAGTTSFLFTQPYLTTQGVPVGALGLVLAPIQLVAMAGSLTAHALAVRVGERTAFYAVTGINTTALLILGAVSSPLAISMFAVLRWSGAARMPLASDHINRRSPAHLRATVASAGTMMASLFTAMIEYPLGLLADATSLRTMFLTVGAGAAVLGGAALAAWTAAMRAEAPADTAREPVAVEG